MALLRRHLDIHLYYRLSFGVYILNNEARELSAKPYVVGFAASLVFTLGAYLSVVHHALNRRNLIILITTLALAQFITQLVFFLHLLQERGPRWKLLVFFSMIIVVGILVAGSLWIMNNLNYHMSLQQMYQYLNNQGDGI